MQSLNSIRVRRRSEQKPFYIIFSSCLLLVCITVITSVYRARRILFSDEIGADAHVFFLHLNQSGSVTPVVNKATDDKESGYTPSANDSNGYESKIMDSYS